MFHEASVLKRQLFIDKGEFIVIYLALPRLCQKKRPIFLLCVARKIARPFRRVLGGLFFVVISSANVNISSCICGNRHSNNQTSNEKQNTVTQIPRGAFGFCV